jgi:hypothetical protein
MSLVDVGGRVSLLQSDPFYLTTPKKIDVNITKFAGLLGDLEVSFVPVQPAFSAETGMCHRNVAEHVAMHGGYAAFGYAFWKSDVLLMAEFHAVWVSPDDRLVDVTPAAEGERDICFARDWRYGPDYDFSDRPQNRAMSIVCKVDPEAVANTIAALPPARIAYERRRADHAGLDLETYLARKLGRKPLAVTVEELIAACEKRDSLMVPTANRVLCKDPQAFRIVQSKVSKLERQVRLHLATEDGVKPYIKTSEEKLADVTVSGPLADKRTIDAGHLKRERNKAGAASDRSDVHEVDAAARLNTSAGKHQSGFDDLIEALLNPTFDVVAFDLSQSGPKMLFGASTRPTLGTRSRVAGTRPATRRAE